MKKNLTILAIAILGLVAFAGCKKSSSSSNGTMSATIGGKSFTGNDCFFSTVSGLVIDGFNGSGTTLVYPYFTLAVTGYTAGSTGTYTIDGFTNIAGIDSSGTNVAVAAYGTITVTSATSSSLKGTFSFTCTDSTKVTLGSFTASNK
jgi:hypothetical protein